jgi:hypothetical protein
MIPTVAGFSGVCGFCGISPEALTREKRVSWSKFCFLNVLALKETPPTPQTPQPASGCSSPPEYAGPEQAGVPIGGAA